MFGHSSRPCLAKQSIRFKINKKIKALPTDFFIFYADFNEFKFRLSDNEHRKVVPFVLKNSLKMLDHQPIFEKVATASRLSLAKTRKFCW